MFVAHALGIGGKIVGELTQEPTPRRVKKPGMRAELFELAHHRRFTQQRRNQTADHFEQEPIRFPAAIDFDASRERRIVLSSVDQRTILESIQKENSA